MDLEATKDVAQTYYVKNEVRTLKRHHFYLTDITFIQGKQTNINMFTKTYASAGNRTRAARVAGEHSTTEPPMLYTIKNETVVISINRCLSQASEFKAPIPVLVEFNSQD